MSTVTREPRAPGDAPGARSWSRSAGAPTPRRRAVEMLCLGAPCAVAAALVLFELAGRSLWLDEAATVSIASQHGAALWSAISHDGGNMLGYYLLQHVLIGWFGDGAALIRLPSALATVATVGLVALLARRLFGRGVALPAGLLAAVSLPLMFWGQDARAYALMIMFITASFVALVRLLEGGRAPWWSFTYALSLTLAMYMSFVAALVVPAQLLVLAGARRDRWRPVLTGVVAAAAACLPMAILAAQRGAGQLFWVPPTDLKRVGEMLRWVSSAGMPPNFHPTATADTLLVASWLLLALAAVRTIRRPDWRPALLIAWLLVPLGLCLAESLVGQPIALARNSLVALPAVSLLLAWVLVGREAAAGGSLPRISWAGWIAVAAVLGLRALQLAPSYASSPEDWRAAARYVEARTQAGDCVAFYPLDGWMAFAYYVRPSLTAAPISVLPAAAWRPQLPYVERYVTPSPSQLSRTTGSCPRLWLIASHEGQRAGSAAVQANLRRFQEFQEAMGGVYRRSDVERRFGWASPVRVELFAR